MQIGVESLGAHGGIDRRDAPALDALNVDQVVLGDRRESPPVPPGMVTVSERSTSDFSAGEASAAVTFASVVASMCDCVLVHRYPPTDERQSISPERSATRDEA
jgi:hypothetical protein